MRHTVTITRRIRGLRAAIGSPQTPMRLKQSLVRQLTRLEAIRPKRRGRRASTKKKRAGILKWLIK